MEAPSLSPNSELDDQPTLVLVVLPSPAPPRGSPDPKSTPESASLSRYKAQPKYQPGPTARNAFLARSPGLTAVPHALPTLEQPEQPALSKPRTTRDGRWSSNPKTRMQIAEQGRRRVLRGGARAHACAPACWCWAVWVLQRPVQRESPPAWGSPVPGPSPCRYPPAPPFFLSLRG